MTMTREDRLFAMPGRQLIAEADKLGVKVSCNKTRTALKESKDKVVARILAAETVTEEVPATETVDTTTETTVPTTEPVVDTTETVEPVKKVKKVRKVRVAVTPEVVTTFVNDLTAVIADLGFELKTWDKIKNLYAIKKNGKAVLECYVGRKNYRINTKAVFVPESVEATTIKNYYLPACVKGVAYTDTLVFDILKVIAD